MHNPGLRERTMGMVDMIGDHKTAVSDNGWHGNAQFIRILIGLGTDKGNNIPFIRPAASTEG